MITIQSALRSLNVTGKYKGFRYTGTALKLILEDEDWLTNLSRKLYPHIADQYQCTPKSVEDDIRYVSHKVWKVHQTVLEKISKRTWYKAPSNIEFLTMIYNYIKRS